MLNLADHVETKLQLIYNINRIIHYAYGMAQQVNQVCMFKASDKKYIMRQGNRESES